MCYYHSAVDDLIEVRDRHGRVLRRFAWRAHLMVSHGGAGRRTVRYEYEPMCEEMREAAPDGAAPTPNPTPPAARPARIIDARGGIKRLAFDACGQLTAHTDCSGHTTHYRYNGRGQLLTIEDATGGRTRYQYDRFDRLAAVTDAAGATTGYGHDDADRLISIEDPAGRVHRQRFDAAGRLTAQIPHGGAPLEFSFDAADRLITLITPNGTPHRLGYDALDRLITETTPDGRTLRYHYDALGQLTAREDNGLTVRHDYDTAGRLISRGLPATAAAAPALHRYVWHGTRLVEAHDGLRSLYFEHGAAGRITRETLRPAGEPPAEIPTAPEALIRSLAHHYGPLGERTHTRLPNGLTLTQLSYGSGHVHQIAITDRSQDVHTLADFEHDPLYRPRRIHLGGQGGPIEALAFGPRGELRETSLHPPIEPIDPLAPIDPIDALIGADEATDPLGPAIRWQRYRYDTLGRLISREQPHNGNRGRTPIPPT